MKKTLEEVFRDQASIEKDIILNFENVSTERALRVSNFDPTVALKLVNEISAREKDGILTLEKLELLFSGLRASGDYWLAVLHSVKANGITRSLDMLSAYTNRNYWDTFDDKILEE